MVHAGVDNDPSMFGGLPNSQISDIASSSSAVPIQDQPNTLTVPFSNDDVPDLMAWTPLETIHAVGQNVPPMVGRLPYIQTSNAASSSSAVPIQDQSNTFTIPASNNDGPDLLAWTPLEMIHSSGENDPPVIGRPPNSQTINNPESSSAVRVQDQLNTLTDVPDVLAWTPLETSYMGGDQTSNLASSLAVYMQDHPNRLGIPWSGISAHDSDTPNTYQTPMTFTLAHAPPQQYTSQRMTTSANRSGHVDEPGSSTNPEGIMEQRDVTTGIRGIGDTAIAASVSARLGGIDLTGVIVTPGGAIDLTGVDLSLVDRIDFDLRGVDLVELEGEDDDSGGNSVSVSGNLASLGCGVNFSLFEGRNDTVESGQAV